MFSVEQIAFLKKNFKDVEIYNDTTSEDQAIERIKNKNIVIMDQFMFTFGEKLLQAFSRLELIIINTTAYDKIDIHLLNKYKVKLANLRDYATEDVAEIGLGMIMALNSKQEIAQKIVKNENVNITDYKYTESVEDIWPGHPIIPFIQRRQLKNQTIGIVGLGNIGQRTAEKCLALGMKVIGFNRTRKYINGVGLVPLRRLFQEADIIYIALSYDNKTMNKMISEDYLTLARNDTIFVSVSHPNLLDMDYLINNHEKFRGIGMDYLVTDDVERLLKRRTHNIIVTPHLGSQSEEAYLNMTETIIEAAVSFSTNTPLYLVN